MPVSPALAALIQAIQDPTQADQISLMLAARAAPPSVAGPAQKAAAGAVEPAPAPAPVPGPTVPTAPPMPEPGSTAPPMPIPPTPAEPAAPPGGGVFSGVGTEFAKQLLGGGQPGLTITPNAPAAVAGGRGGMIAPPIDPYQYLMTPQMMMANRTAAGQRPMSLGQLILGR